MFQKLVKFLFISSFLIAQTITSNAQTITPTGLKLIKYYESFRSKAYKCPADVWTIGYGSTGNGVISGMIITEIQAENLLRNDVKRFERHIKKNVYRITQWNEFDALVSFTFNVGYRIKDGLRTFVNSGNTSGVISKLMLYNKAKVNGIYIVLKGLTKRRTSESILYSESRLNL